MRIEIDVLSSTYATIYLGDREFVLSSAGEGLSWSMREGATILSRWPKGTVKQIIPKALAVILKPD